MARTIQQIYDSMILEKQVHTELNALQPNIDSAQTLLNDLNSPSKVAIWRTLFFTIAVSIWVLEKLFDEHVKWIENRAKELIVGTTAWYHTMALKFQYGDALVFANDKYEYATVNEVAKIVKLVSVNEVGGQVLIKVAKLDSSLLPIPLTTPELDAFKAYMQKVKVAGVKLVMVSRVADLLKINYVVYYDPLVLTSTGELISTPGVKPVEDTINNYIKSLPFDGVFTVTELTDKIQQTIGVKNPVFQSAFAKLGVNPYVSVGDYYKPNAGYLQVDSSFPLSGSITYIPYV
jgi:hypothetical protein